MNTEEFLNMLGAAVPGDAVCPPINCGTGVSFETHETGSDEDSFMLLSRNVDELQMRCFVTSLSDAGKKRTFYREDSGNIFAQFKAEDFLIYTYFTRSKGELRVILDRAGESLEDFPFTADWIREDNQLMQFSLYYGDMIKGKSSDCGMMYALRVQDNSVILVDGGSLEQATEEACDEFMARLRELTKTDENGTIRISAWFCTHNHDDHMNFFSKLLRRESAHLKVERVMFNFPSRTLLDYSDECTDRLKSRLKEYAPDAKFMKLHTGMRFYLCNSLVEVLTSHEDILPRSPRADGNKVYRSMNESGTVIKITFNDLSVIFLGDAEETNGEAMISLYGKNSLNCIYLQCAHHMLNEVRNIYSSITARTLLVPQSHYNLLRKCVGNFSYLKSIFGEENMYIAGDCTTVFSVCENNRENVALFEPRGSVFDNSAI